MLLVVCSPVQAAYLGFERAFYQAREDESFVRIGVALTNAGDLPATVHFYTWDETATTGQDYAPKIGRLEFAPGEKLKFITLALLNDLVVETNETFRLDLWDAERAQIGEHWSTTINISDNDSSPGVEFACDVYPVQENEGRLTLRVVRNNDLDLSPFTVGFSTRDGDAVAGEDYEAGTGELAFAEGELSKEFTILIKTDALPEADEAFTVTLSPPSGSKRLGRNTTAAVRISEPVNPLLLQMLGSVQQPQLRALMRQITGEEPVLIGGETYAITNRNTRSVTSTRFATQYALEQLQALGLHVQFQDWQLNDSNSRAITGRNVVAVQPGGTHANEIIVVAAHYDDIVKDPAGRFEEWAPGADDNASGSAAVLSAARILSQYRFDRTVHFVLFTGEENGLLGSAHFVADARAGGSNIVGTLILDMLAKPGDPNACSVYVPWDQLGADTALASTFTNLVANYAPGFTMPRPVVIPNWLAGGTSDQWSFWQAGFPAIWICDDGNARIHTTYDVLSTLDMDYFTRTVRAVIAMVAHLARPVATNPVTILEVANSDWTLRSGVGGSLLYAKYEPGATETNNDPQDQPYRVATNSHPKSLIIYTEPCQVPLQTDSRPPESETPFRAKLAASDSTHTGISCSNRLRFTFLTPPDPNRIYLARIHLDGRYLPAGTDFDCVTNLHAVVAAGGFVSLPNLANVPDGAVYGTCDIAARFLSTDPSNCMLRLASVGDHFITFTCQAQLGTEVVDYLEFSTNLAAVNAWTPLTSYTNSVTPDTTHFVTGWKELTMQFAPVLLPSCQVHFFRLKRTWSHP